MNVSSLNLLLIGLFVRLLILCSIEYLERLNDVPLTDVDYYVFKDAAAFVHRGMSPYERHTYRYTPLLAWLLLPTATFAPFGKLLFIICDVLSAALILRASGKAACAFYLFNPLTIGIAVRGNAEALIGCVSLLSLSYCDTWWLSAPLLALAVHLKTYPAPWAFTIWLRYAAGDTGRKLFGLLPWSKRGVEYGLLCFAVFVLLSLGCYHLYNDEFLTHAHLHHLTRQDTRHNFSVWFLSFYLSDGSSPFGLLCFSVQMGLCIAISFRFRDEVYFASFLQTFVFVTFNKVITSQYFIWYISLLPLVAKHLHSMTPKRIAFLTMLWFFSQGAWLLPAYLFEMRGLDSFLWMHLGSLLHFSVNIFIAVQLVNSFNAKKIKVN